MEEQIISPTPNKTEPIQVLLTFSGAIAYVTSNRKITKLEWGNEDIYGKLVDGILMIHKADGQFYQWIISDGDLTGDDWVVLPQEN